jgi:hypothetical protein
MIEPLSANDQEVAVGKQLSASIIPLGVDEASRKLIYQAIPNAISIRIAPLDKGLSGATIWLADWSMHHSVRSAPHVLKIDAFEKLQEEKRRVDDYVAAVDPSTGHIALFGPVDGETSGEPARGLLRQGYIGNAANGPISLRNWMQRLTSNGGNSFSSSAAIEDAQRSARARIKQLYRERMQLWHTGPLASEERHCGNIRNELSRRLKHFNKLTTMIQALGSRGIEESLQKYGLSEHASMLPGKRQTRCVLKQLITEPATDFHSHGHRRDPSDAT